MVLDNEKKLMAARQVEEIHMEARMADARLRLLTLLVGFNIGISIAVLLAMIL